MSSITGAWKYPVRSGQVTVDRFPMRGELILVHLNTIDSPTGVASTAAVTLSTASISTNSGGSGQAEGEMKKYWPHVCIILNVANHVDQQGNVSWSLDLRVTHSFSAITTESQGHVDYLGVNHFVPLPPPPGHVALQPPALFGLPLNVKYVPKKYCWIAMKKRTLQMGSGGRMRSFVPPIFVPSEELLRLTSYMNLIAGNGGPMHNTTALPSSGPQFGQGPNDSADDQPNDTTGGESSTGSPSGANHTSAPFGGTSFATSQFDLVAADTDDSDLDLDDEPTVDWDGFYDFMFPEHAAGMRAQVQAARYDSIHNWRHEVVVLGQAVV